MKTKVLTSISAQTLEDQLQEILDSASAVHQLIYQPVYRAHKDLITYTVVIIYTPVPEN